MRPVWWNGRLVAEDAVRISPFDHGLLVGDGVFETLCACSGALFAMRRHHDRMLRGAAVLGLDVPDRELLRGAGEEVVRANGLGGEGSRARVRITLTGGLSPLGSDKGDGEPTVVIAAVPAPVWDAAATVVTVPFTRNECGALAGVKSTSYAENVIALSLAKKRGASEAIFGNTRGELCEGTGSNIFLIRNDGVVTPPLESGCLAGVTRGIVLDLCRREGIPVREEAIALRDLDSVGEAFLTSTTREVQPVGIIDGRPLPVVAGETTVRLAALFRQLVRDDPDP